MIDLKVVATFSGGSSVERTISINLTTGEIVPLKVPRAGRIGPPMFNDMMLRETSLTITQQRGLALMLGAGLPASAGLDG